MNGCPWAHLIRESPCEPPDTVLGLTQPGVHATSEYDPDQGAHRPQFAFVHSRLVVWDSLEHGPAGTASKYLSM